MYGQCGSGCPRDWCLTEDSHLGGLLELQVDVGDLCRGPVAAGGTDVHPEVDRDTPRE